jgi:signal transduction histidine kinase
VLLLLVTVYFLRRLGRVNLRLRGLAARLETAREEERKQIARDLHDEMGQYLTALRLDISGIDLLCAEQNSLVTERTRALKALVDKAISVMRSIVTSIRPAPLEMGVVSALEWLADEFSKTSGITCQLNVSPNVPDLMGDKYMTAVFRVVQESLTNIVKHAGATNVNIRLSVSDRKFFLCIADNGIGFNLKEVKQHCYGLTGMRERAYMLGGELTLHSQANGGTEVCLTFSINESDVIND